MSKRLLQRGRYPKGPGINTYSNPSQYPQTTSAQHPVTSEVPFYNPVQSQPSPSVWNPSYPNPGPYQAPALPASQPNAYWSSGQMYPQTQESNNDPWNWPTENNSENSSYPSYQQQTNNQLEQQNYQEKTQQNYPEQTQQNYPEQTQQQNYPEQVQPNYVQQQSNYHPYPNYQQQQPIYPMQPLVPPTDAWQHIPAPQLENQNFVSQHALQDSSSQQSYEATPIQGINNNSNAALDTSSSLQSWENGGSLNITEPRELPWTYSAPQYYNPTQNLSTDFPPSSVPSSNVPSWNCNNSLLSKSDSEISSSFNQSHPLPVVSLSNDTIMNGGEVVNNVVEEQRQKSVTPTPLSIEPESSQSTAASNCIVPSSGGVDNESHHNNNNSKDLAAVSDGNDFCNSSLSAFFQNSDPNSECGGTLSPEGKIVVDTTSLLEENVSRLAINDSEMSSVPTEDEQNLEEDTEDDGGNQEVHFIQEEVNHVYESMSVSPAAFSEEPVNQEVPEPNKEESAQPVQLTQDYQEVSPEEPLNQQIPVESGEKSRSTSSERERVVIRPREESPFKPPKISSNSKGTIVQQETDVQNITEGNHSEEKPTVVQEVNLETFPDNLERPPDYEELRKQSSFYASHQKHLRTELNSSPSSLLCDNPDIPCVTLAPAAPPLHSSAKSDKSESSSDSKREMASYNAPLILRNVGNEPNLTSPAAGMDSEPSDPSANVSRSDSTHERTSARSSSKKSHPSVPPEQESSGNAPNDPLLPYLKESKIKEPRNVAAWKHVPSMENLQNPNSYSSANSDYSSSSRSRPSNPRYPAEAEYNRQRFADRKYPSFDERQYYSDRERSRPSSRASLDDRSEDYRYPPPQKAADYYPSPEDRRRGHPDSGRPPSRMSESDMSRHAQYGDYYNKQQQYPYGGHNQDYYQRPPNYRGYEYDSYQRDPYYASYYDAYRYAYSNYNYGFYDELYRNDPRYRQYREEQYRQYYAKYGYEGEYDRSSAHSGRSSANELSKDMASTQYLEHDMDSNASEISAYNLQQDYTYDAPNEVSASAAENSSTPSTRLTPVKFSYSHPIVRFSAGGLLITAVPSAANPTLAAPVNIQNMQMIMENEESFQELKNYQGPLIRGSTHKNDVIDFCNQKIKLLRRKDDVVDRDSYILLWELMILLLRQNGSVAGSDIAELLLNDHEMLRPHAAPPKPTVETPQGEHSPAEVNDSSGQSHAGDTSSPDEGIVVLLDKTVLNNSVPKTVDVDKVTRKFREFLLFGHKKDALEWAMKHGLWGHALFLASKMDLRTYANVMTRFANSLALNDPLQTLYQLMSGRQPSAVTCVADKKWGDWRPHLAMILSNPSTLPDVDSRSITTLGDTLASGGCLPAAQFCYIMAQVEFGSFHQKSSKLVLLNADHRLSFEEFATNEAIQCSEIYEYAQSLANPSYLLIHLQMYKFLYALRLVEHGLLEEALHYCEVIAGNLQTHTSLFSYDLISEVFKLASKLKYHDPHFLQNKGEFEDQEDPEWLKNLHVLVQNYNNIIQGGNSEIIYEQQPEPAQTVNEQLTPPADNVGYQTIPGPGIQAEVPNSVNNQQNNWNSMYQQTNWNQQNMTVPNSSHFANNQQEMHPYYSNEMNNQSNFQMESSVPPSHEENETTDVPSSPVAQTPPFDYYSATTQQISDPKQASYDPAISSYNNSSGGHGERRDSALSSGSRYSAANLSVSRKPTLKEANKVEAKAEAKPSSQAGKTWLGGIFSRLLPKAPNQMILPDDKNPTIVWDEVHKRWVNKDSNDEDETNSPLAPPTDMELMGSKSSEKPAVPLGHSMPPVATSPVNKFQRPKTRGMRQNYVDILNNSGATTKTHVPPEALFPTAFEQGAPQSSLFVPPTASSVGENNGTELETANPSFGSHGALEPQEQPRALSSAPLMFDPAEFESRRSTQPDASNQRHTMGRTGRRAYPR